MIARRWPGDRAPSRCSPIDCRVPGVRRPRESIAAPRSAPGDPQREGRRLRRVAHGRRGGVRIDPGDAHGGCSGLLDPSGSRRSRASRMVDPLRQPGGASRATRRHGPGVRRRSRESNRSIQSPGMLGTSRRGPAAALESTSRRGTRVDAGLAQRRELRARCRAWPACGRRHRRRAGRDRSRRRPAERLVEQDLPRRAGRRGRPRGSPG